MQLLSTRLAIAALFIAAVNAQFQINTPVGLAQCVPSLITWIGGQAPFFLSINPGGVPGATALQQYSGLTGTSFMWSTNISSGTSVGFELIDAEGEVAQSAPGTIHSGSSSSCLDDEQSGGSSTSTFTTSTASSTGAGRSAKSTSAPGATTPGSTKAETTSSTESQNKVSLSASSNGAGTSGSDANVPSTSEVSTTLIPSNGLVPTLATSAHDSSSSGGFVGTSTFPAPAPTSALFPSKHGLGTGTIIGMAVGIGAAAVLLAVASFLCVKRRRNREPIGHTDPFTGTSQSFVSRGDRNGPAMVENVETQANSGSISLGASPIDASPQARARELLKSHRANILGGVTAEKSLPTLTPSQVRSRNHTGTTSEGTNDVEGRPEARAAPTFPKPVSGRGVERRKDQRHETDGGVRLAGGRPGEVVMSDDPDQDSMSESSMLPPPYSSHFGEM